MAEAPQENPQVTSSDVVEASVRETGTSAGEEEVIPKAAAPNPAFNVETAPTRFKLGGVAYVRESEVLNGVRAPKKRLAAC